MYQLRSISELKSWRRSLKGSLGFVPTMGDLHAGHESLVSESISQNAVTLVSIYLNPTQFNDPADLDKYAKPLESDLAACQRWGVDAVFMPDTEMLYPDNYRYRVSAQSNSFVQEGAMRPGHFEGVLTVVLKLLLLVQANRAYFGEKDWQQLTLVNGMKEAFFIESEIVPVPTVRELSGLAMSSRNRRLSKRGKIKAAEFFRILSNTISPDDAKKSLHAAGFNVEYVEDHAGRRLAAVELEGVRLIDNVPTPVC